MDAETAKDKGSAFFKQSQKDNGCLVWRDLAVDIDKAFESSSWPRPVERGGKRFVSQLAELYFLVRLNIAQVQLSNMQTSDATFMFAMMAEDSLDMAARALKRDHWILGFEVPPSIQHLAKLRYRLALLVRLQHESGTSDRALRHIDGALSLQPGDAGITVRNKQVNPFTFRDPLTYLGRN
ncbi:hypothetical protein EK21DRAFT_117501 [Setomelanomma holmii]|uniref:Uncharacterized protein n=1 Tax=Setomelanomma holmii TaxID=210430 RepID=A0A9P4GZC8_9PLEO|nr:hypothetical protein EK21DRAFT_117501 [Setomelanomma holmii]